MKISPDKCVQCGRAVFVNPGPTFFGPLTMCDYCSWDWDKQKFLDLEKSKRVFPAEIDVNLDTEEP